MSGQKSKKANRININNAVYCKMLTDEAGSTTYDEPKSLSPAMQVQLTTTLATGVLHGNGVQQENIAKITGISMVLDVNKVPIEDRAVILGNKYENGILEEVEGDEAPYIAVGYISIHAPAQGATGHLINSSRRGRYFNPRPRAGSDSNFS